jgi:hypothetical protein
MMRDLFILLIILGIGYQAVAWEWPWSHDNEEEDSLGRKVQNIANSLDYQARAKANQLKGQQREAEAVVSDAAKQTRERAEKARTQANTEVEGAVDPARQAARNVEGILTETAASVKVSAESVEVATNQVRLHFLVHEPATLSHTNGIIRKNA